MKLKKMLHIGSSLVVALSSLLFINFGTALAAPNNCSWTGAGDGTSFNDAANWTSCNSTYPQSGDSLVFDNTSLSSSPTLNNNISSLSVGGITFSGSGNNQYVITGSAFTLTGGIDNSTTSGCFGGAGCFEEIDNNIAVSGNQSMGGVGVIELKGALSGSGAITMIGSGSLILAGDNSGYSGGFTNANGSLQANTATALGTATTSISNGGSLILGFDADETVSTPLNIGGTGDGFDPAVFMNTVGMAGDGSTVTMTGAISLTSDVNVGGFGNRTMKITGALSGNYSMTPWDGDSNAVIINDSSNNTSKTPSGDVPITVASTVNDPTTAFTAGKSMIYIIDGTRGDGTVMSGGTLEGTGKIGNLTVQTGGVVAPGHSPGCLSTGNLTLNGTYQAQLGGTTACSGYDQLNVTGTVDVTNATLNTSLYGTFKPKAGNSFTIINNDGTDKVTGTFSGLKEGATFKVSGYVFKISYVGGTGNDVVLSVVSVPTTPDTGFAFTGSNPAFVLAGTAASALALLIIGRKTKLAFERR